MRKASKKLGDDTTLTRWVKLPGRHATPGAAAPVAKGLLGTRYPSRVVQPSSATHLLISGVNNVKIGRDVRKGLFKGYWIYTLALEERRTCPLSCAHWRTCYGNNMPFAQRIDHTGLLFLERLEDEVKSLLGIRGRKGLLVRLHALGDFYSKDYVHFWERMLESHPRLAVFGYTAWETHSPIGFEVYALRKKFGRRFAVRFSNGGGGFGCTVSIKAEEDCPKGAFVCPEQTNRTSCCATCSLCWSTDKNVAFLEH